MKPQGFWLLDPLILAFSLREKEPILATEHLKTQRFFLKL